LQRWLNCRSRRSEIAKAAARSHVEMKTTEEVKMKNERKAGFTLVEIMIVVAIIGLLAVIAIPSFVRARQTTQTNACINNLRQIDGAKDQYAIENNKSTGDAAAAASIEPYMKRTLADTKEPLGGDYSANIGVIGTDPTCPNYAAGTHAATI
jgi:prepilin-type N-terminal cleavage/methylation domain-containing protein